MKTITPDQAAWLYRRKNMVSSWSYQEVEQILSYFQKNDDRAYQAGMYALEMSHMLNLQLITMEQQAIKHADVTSGMKMVYSSYFLMLRDTVFSLFSQVCTSILHDMRPEITDPSSSKVLQQEFDFSS